MHSQFIREFVNIIYRPYNDNVIVTRKKYRVKRLFKVFAKHTFVLSFIVILKKVNLFSSHSKSFSSHHRRYYSFL